MEKYFEIIPYKDGFVVVERTTPQDCVYIIDKRSNAIARNEHHAIKSWNENIFTIIAATSNLNLDVPVIDWPEDESINEAKFRYQHFENPATRNHFELGFQDGFKSAERKHQDIFDKIIDLHNNHGYFQGDNWKVLEQLLPKPKIPKGVWLECEEYIDAEEEIKTGKMWNPKLGVLTKDNKVIPLRWEW